MKLSKDDRIDIAKRVVNDVMPKVNEFIKREIQIEVHSQLMEKLEYNVRNSAAKVISEKVKQLVEVEIRVKK